MNIEIERGLDFVEIERNRRNLEEEEV